MKKNRSLGTSDDGSVANSNKMPAKRQVPAVPTSQLDAEKPPMALTNQSASNKSNSESQMLTTTNQHAEEEVVFSDYSDFDADPFGAFDDSDYTAK